MRSIQVYFDAELFLNEGSPLSQISQHFKRNYVNRILSYANRIRDYAALLFPINISRFLALEHSSCSLLGFIDSKSNEMDKPRIFEMTTLKQSLPVPCTS
jgi:hypothetical protein